MTIRTTPPISLSDVMAELRIVDPNRVYPISLGDADVRALAGRPSGAISLSDLYGKSSYVPMTVYATGGSDFQNSVYGPGTASAGAAASVTGGRGAMMFNWVVLSSIGDPVISGHTTPTLYASRGYTENSNGSATVTARCDVTDETGATASSVEVSIDLRWEGNV